MGLILTNQDKAESDISFTQPGRATLGGGKHFTRAMQKGTSTRQKPRELADLRICCFLC